MIRQNAPKSVIFSITAGYVSPTKNFLPKFSKGGGIAKGQPAIVGERGAELFIPNQAGQITQASRGTGTGTVNVNFNINTIDSRGFDEALVENRGTITSIINNALTERGRGELSFATSGKI